MYGIQESLYDQELNNYALYLDERPFELDCSMGSNPYGAPEFKLTDEMLREVTLYPHGDDRLVEKVCARFADTLQIDDDMIGFSCGSFGCCVALNRMCLRPGKAVVCLSQTFSAITDDMAFQQPVFHRVPLRRENNYKFCLDEFLEAIEANPGAFVYLDNPNNPTGQAIPLAEARRIVEVARDNDSFVVLDEAYGDYMDDEQSALNLVEEFDNLAVPRTFSKAWGIAGARLGYVIGQPSVIRIFNKINIAYAKNSLSEELALQSLEQGWGFRTREHVHESKAKMLAALTECKNLRVAETAPDVSISMLYVDDESVDLEDALMESGIRTTSCSEYEGMGVNSVRLNMHADIDRLIELLMETDGRLG